MGFSPMLRVNTHVDVLFDTTRAERSFFRPLSRCALAVSAEYV
jgi:hypothetical protein